MGINKALLIVLVLAALVGFSLTALSEGVMDGTQISHTNATIQKNALGMKFEGSIPNLKNDFPLSVAWYAKLGVPILDHDHFINALTDNPANPAVAVITELKGPAPSTDSWSWVEITRTFEGTQSRYTMLNMPISSYAISHFAQMSDGIIVPFDYAYNRWNSNNIEDAYAYYYWLIRDNLKRLEPILKGGKL